MQNQVEFSHDHGRIAKQSMYAQDTAARETRRGNTEQKAMITVLTSHSTTFSVKIPLTFISNFFRLLDFPLMNQTVELEVTHRLVNAVLATTTIAGNDLTVTNNNSVLCLPIVELPAADSAR